MTPSDPPLEHLPYYREYLDQILRPRVARLVEEVRVSLATHAWNELLVRLAEDQNPSGSGDPQVIQKMRILLEQTLGLKVGVHMDAEFADGVAIRPPPPPHQEPGRRPDHNEVVDRGQFPDNPLARAVGSPRRTGR